MRRSKLNIDVQVIKATKIWLECAIKFESYIILNRVDGEICMDFIIRISLYYIFRPICNYTLNVAV